MDIKQIEETMFGTMELKPIDKEKIKGLNLDRYRGTMVPHPTLVRNYKENDELVWNFYSNLFSEKFCKRQKLAEKLGVGMKFYPLLSTPNYKIFSLHCSMEDYLDLIRDNRIYNIFDWYSLEYREMREHIISLYKVLYPLSDLNDSYKGLIGYYLVVASEVDRLLKLAEGQKLLPSDIKKIERLSSCKD